MELLAATLVWAACAGAGEGDTGEKDPVRIYFQSHRGGLNEMPENTLPAFEHSWKIPGAVPEMDLRTTKDGVIVCMHDETPKRTTNAPAPWRDMTLREIPFEEVQRWDAGAGFDVKYADTPIPALDQVFEAMQGRPERQAYLDLKDVDLEALVSRIKERGLERQVIFVHGDPEMCLKLQGLYEGARTMTWLSGSPQEMQEKFAELAAVKFRGISQLQFHLRPRRRKPEIVYVLDQAYLAEAVRLTRAAGVDLQLRPFVFSPKSLHGLIALGVHWYVTDEPRAFAASVRKALEYRP